MNRRERSLFVACPSTTSDVGMRLSSSPLSLPWCVLFRNSWDRGLRHGQGICVFANGERFEGEWLRDHISYQGKGALTLADGTTHDFA